MTFTNHVRNIVLLTENMSGLQVGPFANRASIARRELSYRVLYVSQVHISCGSSVQRSGRSSRSIAIVGIPIILFRLWPRRLQLGCAFRGDQNRISDRRLIFVRVRKLLLTLSKFLLSIGVVIVQNTLVQSYSYVHVGRCMEIRIVLLAVQALVLVNLVQNCRRREDGFSLLVRVFLQLVVPVYSELLCGCGDKTSVIIFLNKLMITLSMW
jgi:hypothetical protein